MMKHLKSFNEELKFEYEWEHPLPNVAECERLQKEINKYNDILLNDEVWKNFYHRIDDYYKKKLDSDFLESIIEFGKKRIEEIKKEKEDLLEDVKDIFQDIEDDVDFIKEIKYNQMRSVSFDLWVEIFLTDDVKDINYFGLLPYYTPFANKNIWNNLTIISQRVKSLGLECFTNYTVSKKINFRIK